MRKLVVVVACLMVMSVAGPPAGLAQTPVPAQSPLLPPGALDDFDFGPPRDNYEKEHSWCEDDFVAHALCGPALSRWSEGANRKLCQSRRDGKIPNLKLSLDLGVFSVESGNLDDYCDHFFPNGDAPSKLAYQRAIAVEIAQFSIPPEDRASVGARLLAFGQTYCWLKHSQPDVELSDRVQDVKRQFTRQYGPWRSTNQMLLADAAGEVADTTWCPTGYVNPVTSAPR